MTENNSKKGFVGSWLTSKKNVKVSLRAGSVTAKREAVVTEVKAVTALVEEMLGIAK